jgi:glycosyl transferase family 25
MSDFPILLINLAGSDDRLLVSKRQLDAAGLTFARIEACDGRGKDATSFEVYDPTAAKAFFGRQMTSGEVGCYLSHVAAAQAVVDSGAPYGLVLEDDFEVRPGGWDALKQTIALLDEGLCPKWELINLARAPKLVKSHISQITPTDGTPSILHRAFYFPVIATAILWSRKGAARFLAEASQPIGPVDHVYRRLLSESGGGLALKPAPFTVTGIESDIVRASGGHKPTRFFKGVWWVWLSEIRRQTRALWAARANRRKAAQR